MSEKSWQGCSILVVDDSKLIRESLRGLFAGLGLKVVGEAAHGVEALAQVPKLKPDLVSLDLIMPEMDGVECFRRISQEFPGVLCFINSWLASDSKILKDLGAIIPPHLIHPKTLSAQAMETRLNLVLNPPPLVDRDSKGDPLTSELGVKVS